jgi:pilus assembly protein TadC
VAAVVQAGAAPAAALTAVADAVGGPDGQQLRTVGDRLRLGAADPVAWAGTSSHLLPLRRALELATAAGAPVVVLLQEAADAQRRELQRHAAVAAARLGVRTVLPVGLCALPAFVLLGVAPVVLGLGGALLGAP